MWCGQSLSLSVWKVVKARLVHVLLGCLMLSSVIVIRLSILLGLHIAEEVLVGGCRLVLGTDVSPHCLVVLEELLVVASLSLGTDVL